MANWVKRKLDELSTELLGAAAIAAGLVIGAAIWAAILNWDGPAVMLLVVGLITGTLLAVNQALRLYNQFQPPISRRGDVQAVLQKWALEYGYHIRNLPNPRVIFEFGMGEQGGREVGVARGKDDSEFITVGINLTVTETDRELLGSITGAQGSTLIDDLQIEMARLGVGYAGLGHPLQLILLEDKLLLDESLNKLTFMQRVMFIRRACALLEILIRRAVRQAQQDQPSRDKAGSGNQ